MALAVATAVAVAVAVGVTVPVALVAVGVTVAVAVAAALVNVAILTSLLVVFLIQGDQLSAVLLITVITILRQPQSGGHRVALGARREAEAFGQHA